MLDTKRICECHLSWQTWSIGGRKLKLMSAESPVAHPIDDIFQHVCLSNRHSCHDLMLDVNDVYMEVVCCEQCHQRHSQ